MKKKRILLTLMAVLLLAFGTVTGSAETMDRINAANAMKEETESQIEDARETIDSLETKKAEAISELKDLKEQMQSLSEQLEELTAKQEACQEELEQIEQDLESALAVETTQKQDMALRIRYMYENSAGNGSLQNFFSSGDFTEILSNATIMADLGDADRSMLDQYQQTCEEIEAKKEETLAKKAELHELSEELTEKQEEALALYEQTQQVVSECEASIGEQEETVEALLEEVEAQQEELNSLLTLRMSENFAEVAALAAMASPDGSESEQTNYQCLGNFILTGYCPCKVCCGKWAKYSGITASLTEAKQGRTVAMYGVPFGTKLMINGIIYTVEDRGTPYGHVDIFFDSHYDAQLFGVQHADVYLVETPSE